MPTLSSLDFRNTNSLWGSVLVETLARLGLRQAVISPGSRSTPLTIQFARHPAIESIPVLDERSAAFFALGLARRSGVPVVLLCTSGTAGANYFPAVIEAQESGVPLVVITADRPPEMRECRSGQTIDQQKLFGAHVNFYHELAVPAASLGLLRYLRGIVAHAWARARGPAAGPVHLNAPFRDPLPPIDDGKAGKLAAELDARKFFAAVAPEPPVEIGLRGRLALGGLGVIVAGQGRPADPARYARAVGRIARQLGWPVLADTLSPLRNFSALVPGLVTGYDALARSEAVMTRLQPKRVLVLHDLPVSKALRHWIQVSGAETIFVRPDAQNPDALHGPTRLVRCGVEALVGKLAARRASAGWLKAWRAAATAAERSLARAVQAESRFEGGVAALLPRALPQRTTVFVANSMPVRDLDFFWAGNDRGHDVHCNRGANGIDGTLSTALGLAHGGAPAVMLTGDLALLHDTNGFLSLPKFRGSLTIVLINNAGGGIFGHLPVAQFEPPFEEFFATPQSVDFARLSAAYGARHVLVKSRADLTRRLATLPARGVRVLEVRTDRKRDAETRGRIVAAAALAAERALADRADARPA